MVRQGSINSMNAACSKVPLMQQANPYMQVQQQPQQLQQIRKPPVFSQPVQVQQQQKPLIQSKPMVVSHVVNKVSVSGVAEQQAVKVDMELEIEVFSNKFTLIQLVKEEVAVVAVEEVAKPEAADVHLIVRSGYHTVMTDAKGLYKLTLKCIVAYTNKLNQGVCIPVPECMDTHCSFTVKDEDVNISLTPSVHTASQGSSIDGRIPPTNLITLKWTHQAKPESLPSTPMSESSFVKVGEKDKDNKEKDKEPKKERVITGGQDILHTIGGGTCHTKVIQNYTITNGSVSQFKIKVGKHGSTSVQVGKEWVQTMEPGKVKVVSVDGPTLRSWDFVDDEVTLNLDSAVEGTCSFVLNCEMYLSHNSCHLYLPSFLPQNVNRNKGSVAIQARTAVEIIESDCNKGITKVDVAELPASLKSEANLLLAYKFLVPSYKLCVDAIKHDDVEVIIALCESATYKITHTGEQLLYDLKFNIKNTQCQFLKVLLPPRAAVWSALIAGETVKPAVDNTGKTLLPLVKGSDVAFTASLVFITPAPPLPQVRKEIAQLMLNLPTVDLPITHLRMEVYVPSTHIYAQFVGGIEEVNAFDSAEVLRQVHDENAYAYQENLFRNVRSKKAAPQRALRSRARRESPVLQLQQQCMPPPPQQLMTNCLAPRRRTSISGNFDLERNIDMEDDENEEEDITDESDGDDSSDELACMGGMAVGIKPLAVSTDTLRKGVLYRFEKLLIPSHSTLTVTADTCLADAADERTLQSDMKKRKRCAIQ